MIIRTYACLECGTEFEVELDSGDDKDPPCPACDKVLQWIPGEFSIKTHKSRAIDYTQQVIEQDYGLTNLNDGNREGDVAYKAPPPMQTNERETIEQAVREYVRETTSPVAIPQQNQPQAQAASVPTNFWGAQPTPAVQANPVPAHLMLAGAKVGPQGPNPMSLLQEGIKSGQVTTKSRIVARWKP